MFTEQEIKAAHSKVKTGADFPAYVQEIKALGLVYYEYLVADGTTVYYGANGHMISSAPRYAPIAITPAATAQLLTQAITIHQQGVTSFMTFCQQAADAGVQKWVIDTRTMLCTYYDSNGIAMVAEPIPQSY